MLFSSFTFLCYFLPCVLAGYYILNPKLQNVFLLVASLFFYAWGEPKNVFVMLAVITLIYLTSFLYNKKSIFVKTLYGFSILTVLGILFYFKYTDFSISIINRFIEKDWALIGIILPIGISFYTFQAISYLIDIRRGVKPQKNLVNLALYISLFPQLIAGPIIRYGDIEHQLTHRHHSFLKVYYGFRRFIVGLGKKVIISNSLGVSVDRIFGMDPGVLPCDIAWVGIIFYSLQLYFDFSGYSDMAIGLGRMFGFKFMENFNYPYVSKSITEFWRRWHISLSSWFKSYVYIPLGGNRKGLIRTIINLALVFFLTGIWHGAAWMFVVWGLWHGFFIILEKIGSRLVTVPQWFSETFARLYTLLIVLIGWVFFRSESMDYALNYLKVMFGFINTQPDFSIGYYVQLSGWIVFIIAVFAATAGSRNLLKKHCLPVNISIDIFLLLTLVGAVVLLTASSYNPFIYFRF